jgi:SAM-dependent methyltransferase
MSQELQQDVWKTDPEWFKPWFNTEAYHRLYGHRSEEEADSLVQTLLSQKGLRQEGRALDAGCGAGRHARAFFKRGWQVHAFDLSEASISAARNHPQVPSNENLQFHVRDLRKLRVLTEWAGDFDLVTNFFTSLGYFDEPRAMERIVEDFSSFLKPGGHLVVDYLNPEAVAKGLVRQEQITKEGTTFDIHRRIHSGWIEKSIQYSWDGEPCHHVERVQALTKSSFSAALSNAGLEVVDIWGNYQFDAWVPDSPRTLILAQKPVNL